jgi:flagellar biosynthesis/type III secretory pathway protein FliH
MSRVLAYDRFDAPSDDAATVFVPRGRYAADLAAARLQGFDDALAQARDEAATRASAAAVEISRCLQDAAFTHFEARRAILNALQPVLDRMVATVLPAMASQALADIVAAHVMALAAEQAGEAVCVACAPDRLDAVAEVLAQQRALPVQVRTVADPALGPHEVRFKSVAGEAALDLDAAIASIAEGVTAFYQLQHEERAHG